LSTVIARQREVPSPLSQHRFFGSFTKKRQLLALSLLALTLVVYNSAARLQFVNYDDPHYITENAQVQAGLHWRTIRWSLTTFEFYNWHPLTWISYFIDFQFFKVNPAGYHFMNVVYHAVAAVLLFLVLLSGTGHLLRSFSVAVLFALHPLNVESVAWVAERKNVLSAIFWFLAIWAYGWYSLRPSWKRYVAVAALFLLGLMAKPMVITLPCVLLLLDWWPLRRLRPLADSSGKDVRTEFTFAQSSWAALVLEKVPLFLMSVASAVVTILAQEHYGVMSSTAKYPVGMRVENAVVSYALYLYKAFFPWKLAVFYPHPGYAIPLWKLAASATLLILTCIAVVRLRRNRPYLLVGWLWFVGTIVPVIGLFQNGDQGMADRYAYTPLIGIFLMVAWGMAGWIERNHRRKIPAALLSILILAALIAGTRHQLRFWHDSVSLFAHAVDVTRNNDVAETNLGEALSSEGREKEAAPHFLNAVLYNPKDPNHHYNYGRSLFLAGKPTEAIAEFKLVLQMGSTPSVRARACHNLGAAYLSMGDRDDARPFYEQAIRLNPEGPNSFLMLGLLQLEEGELEAASKNLQSSIRLMPSDIGYFALGQISERQGRLTEAKSAYEKAAQIAPSFAGFQQNLDAVQRRIRSRQNLVEAATPAIS